jgi:taurine transport system substrate-binding protein
MNHPTKGTTMTVLPRRLTRVLGAGLVTTLAVAGLAACGGGGDATSGELSTIRIGYQLIPNGDLVVKDQKLLEKAFGPKVKIEWKQFASGGDVNQAILGGSLDIGLAGSSPVSRGISTGIDYQVPWIFDVIGTAEALVAKPGIASIQDLKGKTVATPLASTSHYSLLSALKDAGLTTKDVNVIDAEPDAIVAAWKAGKIDAAYTWNPSLAELVKDGGKNLIDSSQLAAKGKTTYDLAVVATKFAQQHPDAVQTWVDQENAAVEQINAKDPKAYASIAKVLNISAAEAKAQVAGLVFPDAKQQAGADYLGGGLPKNLYAAAKFNKGLGQIPKVAAETAYTKASVTKFAAAVK